MTLKDIQKRLDAIHAVAHDDEEAHAMEDALHREVLRAIADGAVADPRHAARLALLSGDIDFARWCA